MKRLLKLIRQWMRSALIARQPGLLRQLDTRMLHDIGLKRGDVLAAALGIPTAVVSAPAFNRSDHTCR